MRTTSSIDVTKILPSPMRPVFETRSITSTTRAASWSGTTTSTFTLGRKSTTYSSPRYSSVCPFCRPKPLTSATVRPVTPISESATFTSSSLNGLMMASTFFTFHLVVGTGAPRARRADRRARAEARATHGFTSGGVGERRRFLPEPPPQEGRGEDGRQHDHGHHGRELARAEHRDAVHPQGQRHAGEDEPDLAARDQDRKSTRLNSSHVEISYAVFCLKKKNSPYLVDVKYTTEQKKTFA